MNRLLSGTSLAALLLLTAQSGHAQTSGTQGSTQSQRATQAQGGQQAQPQAAQQAGQQNTQQAAIPPQTLDRLRQAEQTLSQASRQMATTSAAQQPQITQNLRQALVQLQQALAQIPQDRRTGEGYRTLETNIGQARAALEGQRPDMTRARTAVDAVVAAIPPVRGDAESTGASGAQIVLRQSPDQVQVRQPAPQVTVQQARPEVLVVIPQPEIIVRQPPAQVTVRMPEPQVAVQQGQPQVRVEQAQPNVAVVPTQQQAQVQVQQAEPRVTVQQQGQPQIRFEQTGQAQVRVEREGREAAATAPTGPQPSAQGAPPPATQAAAQQGRSAPGMALQEVSELIGTNVVGANGRDAGEVENLLVDQSGRVRAAVVEWGGFLGIGERRAVVPIERIQINAANDRAELNMTRAQLEELGGFDRNNLGQYSTRYGWGDGVRLYR